MALISKLLYSDNELNLSILERIKISSIGFHGTYCDLGMTVIALLNSLRKCDDLTSFLIPVITFIKDITCSSYSDVYVKFGEIIVDFLKFCFQKYTSVFDRMTLNTDTIAHGFGDSMDFTKFLHQFKTILKDKNRFISSEFSARISTFCSLLICLPFLRRNNIDSTWFGFSKVYDKTIYKIYKQTHPISVADGIIEGTIYLLEKICLVLDTGDVKCLYIDNEEITRFESSLERIFNLSLNLDTLHNKDTTLHEFYTDVVNAKEECRRMMEFFTHDKAHLGLLKGQYAHLSALTFKVSDKLRTMFKRDIPIGIVLHGSPGIGKSDLLKKILVILFDNAIALGKMTDRFDERCVYYYNHSDKYWSGLTGAHKVCVMDDAGQLKKELLIQDGGGCMRHSIDMINPTPYITEQAELSNKGMIPFLCDFVMVTTNFSDAGIGTIYDDRSGAKRRYLFIDITVKEEYRQPGSTKIRGDIDPNEFDLHNFHPRKYEPVGETYSDLHWDNVKGVWSTDTKPALNIRELAKFLREEIQAKHYNQQEVAEQSTNNFTNSGICGNCSYTRAVCSCLPAQGSRVRTIESCTFIPPYEEFSYWSCFLFTLILPVYFALDLFGYHSNYLFSNLIELLPNVVVCNETKVLKYIPHSIAKHYMSITWLTGRFSYRCKSVHSIMQQYHENKMYIRFGLVSFVAMLYFARKYWKMNKVKNVIVQAHGNIVHQVEKDEIRPDYQIKVSPLVKFEGPKSTTTYDNLLKCIEGNLCHLTIRYGKMEFDIRGLGIYSNVIALPGHTFNQYNVDGLFYASLIRSDIRNSIGPNRSNILLGDENVFKFLDDDIVYLCHPAFGTFWDIRKYLVSSIGGITKGCYMKRMKDGSIQVNELTAVRDAIVNYYTGVIPNHTPYKHKGFQAVCSDPALEGDCGAPYIVHGQNGVCIAGFHIAGGLSNGYQRGYSIPIINYDFETSYFKAHSFNGIDLQAAYETTQDLSIKCEIHPKDPVNLLAGTGIVYGSLGLPRTQLKTNVCNTMMCEDVLAKLNMKTPEFFSPMNVSTKQAIVNNLEKMLDKPNIPFGRISKASKGLYAWYSSEIRTNKIIIPSKPYDVDVGINGIDEDPYLNRLDSGTSGGFAHKGRKDKQFVVLPTTKQHEVHFGMGPAISKEHSRIKDCYLNGIRANIIWDFNFKDEPISYEKVKNNKCRIFNSGPVAFTILMRQYFLWTIPVLTGKYRCRFGMAIGANCFSSDWKEIYYHVTKHGKDRMIAGDYKAFDKSMPPEMMMCAFDVLIKIAADHGWGEDDLNVMKGIATDICYPVSNCFGTLIEFFGSNPSGHPLTTPINGMCNIMYIMIAVMDIVQGQKIKVDYGNFLDYVSILTYGDDNIMSSKLDLVTHTSISNSLAKYGVVYTMDDKVSESVEYKSIFSCTFLQRNFRPNVIVKGEVAAQLNFASIVKMITVMVRSKTISLEHQTAQQIESANREMFQYGRKKFNKYHHFFKGLCNKYCLNPYLTNERLPNFDELLKVYNEKLVNNDSWFMEEWKEDFTLLPAQSFSPHTVDTEDGVTEAGDTEEDSINMFDGDDVGSVDDLLDEFKIVTYVAASHIEYNFGHRLRIVNINYARGLTLSRFGQLCALNDELHTLLEETWIIRISSHFSKMVYVLDEIRDFSNPYIVEQKWGDISPSF